MSFWSNKPLKLENDCKQILSNTELLNFVTKELDSSKIKLDYKIMDTTKPEITKQIVTFINNNYFSYYYTESLFLYFLGDESISIAFYPVGKKEMIGFICCSKKKLQIQNSYNNKILTGLEVNFLCLNQRLRNLHVSSHMINILTKEAVLRYNDGFDCAYYTTGTKLNTTHFCNKEYYYRPLNIDKLLDMKMLNETFQSISKKKVYTSFSYNKNLFTNKTLEFYNGNGCDNNLLHDVYNKISVNNYEIYDIKTVEDLQRMFGSKDFYIIVLKRDDTITDVIILFRLDIYYKKTKQLCKNGFIYIHSYEHNILDYKKHLLEYIFSYLYHNNTFDSITITDLFNIIDKEYHNMKFIKEYSTLYYYMYNMSFNYITPQKNGLITI